MGRIKELLTQQQDFLYLNPKLVPLCKYLSDKQNAPNRRHKGIELIENLYGTYEFDKVILHAVGVMKQQFSLSYKKGQGKELLLTTLSTAIGRRVIQSRLRVNPDEYRWWDHVKIGDVILEAFFQSGAIDIKRSGNEYRSPYVVQPMAYWIELMMGLQDINLDLLPHTSFKEIPKISTLRQANGRTVIKRWQLDRTQEFKQLVFKPFVLALDNIQKTGWRINERALRILEANREIYTDPMVETKDAKGNTIVVNVREDHDLPHHCMLPILRQQV